MTSKMLSDVGEILGILDSMDLSDQTTALAVISARYGGSEMVSRKKSSKGSGGKSESPRRPILKKESGSGAGLEESNFLDEVGAILGPVIKELPVAVRQQGSMKPHMDLKSVQKRLNTKRRELQKELAKFHANPNEDYYKFRSLNAIQAFRIAAKDAMATKGCRLTTNPIPEGLKDFGPLIELSASLQESEDVLSNGFFSDQKHRFDVPNEGKSEADTVSDDQDDSLKDSPW